MKVTYIAVFDGNEYSGITKKIVSQAKYLRETGLDLTLIFLANRQVEFNQRYIKTCYCPTPPFKNFAHKLYYAMSVAKNISKILKQYNIVYCRSVPPSPFLLKSISKKGESKFIFEMQSITENEAQLRNSKLNLLCSRFLFPAIFTKIDGIVGVTSEITKHYLNLSRDSSKPYLTIGNGIKATDFKVRQTPLYSNDRLELLIVANFQKWHGVDRLIKGISEYKGETNIILNIVGKGSAIQELKDLTSKLRLGDKVLFHGFRSGKELDILFDQCHIAVGSLGIHRIGLKEASILKAREYCARGIPFISAFKDPDFRDGFPYIKRFPADESPIDINAVMDFAETVLSDDNYSINMNNYAKEHLDWSIKMKKLSDFLKELSHNENT